MVVKLAGLLVLIIAAVYDCKSFRIPNTLILIGYGIGMIAAVVSGGASGLLHAVMRAAIPILGLYFLFYIRALGAGDLKLFSVIAIMCSTEEFMDFIIFSFAIGAAISLIRLFLNGQLIVRFSNFVNYIRACVQEGQVGPYHTFDGAGSYLHFSVSMLLAFCAVTLREVFLSRF
ncbi:MAG: A24 family peptidase [Lachnospiraceae bacterium]|nr:A24 family peptidase [Lachnospiraceae bacterium]